MLQDLKTPAITRFLLLLPLLWLGACSTLPKPSATGTAPMQEAERAMIRPLEADRSPDSDPVYKLLLAETAISRGQAEIAVENYLDLARQLDDPRIAERAVRVAIYAQDLEAAQQAAERWIELQPDKLEARQISAVIYIRQKQPEKAASYLIQVLEAQPELTDQDFKALLGILLREQNRETVLEVARRIRDRFSGHAMAQYVYAVIAAQSARNKQALSALDQALKIRNIPDAHALRAKLLIKLGRRDEALQSLRKAVLGKPGDQQLRLAYARLLVDMKQYDKARIEFEKLHQKSPRDADLLYTLGLLALEAQRFDDGRRYLNQLLKLGKRRDEALYYLGRIEESQGNHDRAIEYYEQVRNGEYRFDARLRSAFLLARDGKLEQAIAALEKMATASQSDGSLVRIYLAEGEIYNQAGRYRDAIRAYNKGLKIAPGNTDLLYARGLTAEKVDDLEMLESDMRRILEADPDDAAALNALGFTLADRTDRLQEAYELIRRAIELNPDDPAIIDSFGWVNYRLGHIDEAIRLLRKALSKMDDPEIAAHLGEVLWVTGKRDEARRVWQRALRKSPEDPVILKTMKRLSLN